MRADQQNLVSLLETFDLLGNTIVIAAFYGIAFTLYCLCARLLYFQQQEPDKRWRARFTLAYASLVFSCTTAFLILDSQLIQPAYVANADSPGGPILYKLGYSSTSNMYMAVGQVLGEISTALTMAIQIWRLWVIWSGTQYTIAVSIPPFLLFFFYIGWEILSAVVSLAPPGQLIIIRYGIGLVGAIASYAILPLFTALVTGLVAARLLLVRRYCKRMGVSDTSKFYMGIIAMLIESYALDFIWSTASAISIGFRDSSSWMFYESVSMVKANSYFFLIYRVSSGRAWQRDTGRKLTSLRYNRGMDATTNEARSIPSQAPAITVVTASSPTAFHSEHKSVA